MPLLRQDYPTRVRLDRLRSRVAGHGKHFGFSTTRSFSFVWLRKAMNGLMSPEVGTGPSDSMNRPGSGRKGRHEKSDGGELLNTTAIGRHVTGPRFGPGVCLICSMNLGLGNRYTEQVKLVDATSCLLG